MIPEAARPREVFLNGIRRELLGPAGCGFAMSVPPSGPAPDAFQPHVDAESGEEILALEAPLNRYGLGVLYPKLSSNRVELTAPDTPGLGSDDLTSDLLSEALEATGDEGLGQTAENGIESILERSAKSAGLNDSSDDAALDLVDTTRRKASSMAVSFRLRTLAPSRIHVSLPDVEPGTLFAVNGRYEPFKVSAWNPKKYSEQAYNWWVRRQMTGRAVFITPGVIEPGNQVRLELESVEFHNLGPLELEFSAFARPYPGGEPGDQVITVVLSNRTLSRASRSDDLSLFQSYFEVIIGDDTRAKLKPLIGIRARDDASRSLNFLYRKAGAFAVGHGCSGNWAESDGQLKVIATHFPTFEVASMTPELPFMKRSDISLSMKSLAGSASEEKNLDGLKRLCDEYERWLDDQTQALTNLRDEDLMTAERHLDAGRTALQRMRNGIQLIESDVEVGTAFKLMNHAMLLQQVASRVPKREFVPAKPGKPATYMPAFFEPNHDEVPQGRGMWRPFQIGFILSALTSTAITSSDDRDLVDLIWFPTGGGKTEAYLGLSAFSAFLRRIRNPNDSGTEILMRYTLRLLTAQQFERASSLICAMDRIRQDTVAVLGEKPFSIGLWVGGSTTPNNWADAKAALQDMVKGSSSRNPFLISKCPWCGAGMGPTKASGKGVALGYEPIGGKVSLRCPDPACPFSQGLPVRVVDEDLYERPPTLVIATVDKYAQLSWNPRPRAFFGLDSSGARIHSPPNLIIQDELHLITGPLGTMVGSYEVVVEHLSTLRLEPSYKPKIVCSTATIRNYSDQIRWLFARNATALFPPPSLDIDDSFFGVKAQSDTGHAAPGRKYVGVFAPALGSHMSVQIRVYAAALQSVMNLAPEHRDPYWTLLGFFNTLRDLGSTTTLLRDQIKSHLLTMWRRHGLLDPETQDARRQVYEIEELTGRLRSEEVPATLEMLTNSLGSNRKAVDVCLASNMIEVGIDVDRLGLMVVTGQPKTNAQYIQVTGRVGRDWAKRPGLVIVAYSPNRARDRSVFETFRANHERLYASVEPASVTPFSLPALQRGLHATMIAYVRQTMPLPFDDPSRVEARDLEAFHEVLVRRVRVVDPDALPAMEHRYERLLFEWERRRPTVWEDWQTPDNMEALQVPASGRPRKGDWRWRTPQSMRNVDSESIVDSTVVRIVDMSDNPQGGAQ